MVKLESSKKITLVHTSDVKDGQIVLLDGNLVQKFGNAGVVLGKEKGKSYPILFREDDNYVGIVVELVDMNDIVVEDGVFKVKDVKSKVVNPSDAVDGKLYEIMKHPSESYVGIIIQRVERVGFITIGGDEGKIFSSLHTVDNYTVLLRELESGDKLIIE